MANTKLFESSKSSKQTPKADTVNNAGGVAYSRSDKQSLAQIACTNTFNGTYYVDSDKNLQLAQEAVTKLQDDPEFIAKVALYARDKGYMKDMPAFLCVALANTKRPDLFRKVFRSVINNGKMLGNIVQMARSGKVGKVANLSSGKWRHALRDWFKNHNEKSIFTAATRSDVKMSDIIKMSRPKPDSDSKNQFYRYLLGKSFEIEGLPEPIRSYELFKKGKTKEIPDVDFQYLTSLNLDTNGWKHIAKNAGWTMTRMNLNTFQRHDVFDDPEMIEIIANRLKDPEQIKKAKAFPYQLWVAYNNATEVPFAVKEALQDAMEIAVSNVPVFQGQTYVAIDVSGSMGWSVTGSRGNATSTVRCVDVASLFGAAFLRNNKSAKVMPFSDRLYPECHLNPRDTVISNAHVLSGLPSGGTNCALVVEDLVNRKVKGDAIVFVSDNESWIDSHSSYYGTGLMDAWKKFKKINPKARLVCIDLTPNTTSQVKQYPDILQIAGFSDVVWDVVNTFLQYGNESDHWVSEIEKIDLDDK